MMKFCPLCIRNGLKRKIKAFQVNFKEAVWSCEAETCPWPIGFEELTYFARDAFGCDWDEEAPPPIGISEENISMELLLYTPPVTPGEELSKESTDSVSAEYSGNPSLENKLDTLLKSKVNSSKECTGSLPILRLSELKNNFIEERNSTKEDNASACACKTMPKVTKIQKTNLDITFLSKNNECCDKEKMYKHNKLPIDVTSKDIAENTFFDNTLCKTVDLDTQCKRLDDTMNGAEKTNFNSQTLSEIDIPLLLDANDTNNQNKTNNSSLNNSDVSSNIDKILEGIMSTENPRTENTNNDWLYALVNM
ncbi:uncharacterized protein LOC114943420 [Nylanderia fulva]|uniref:uncharacterized protein LOC114943420 n=1 Tax=Nylanderia fulva TaxID=613905 RepID=UPI0010FAD8D6|nr:uncharacterized protein LOC114943420 [Nylanderia fulva]